MAPQQVDTTISPSATGPALALAKKHASDRPLKLYAGWFCPFVQRAWITLQEKGVDYQYIEINPYHKTPEFLALNPRGLIPTLVLPPGGEGGGQRVLYESMIVCEYLDEEYTNSGTELLPRGDAYERARQRLWVNFVEKRLVAGWYRFMQHTADKAYSLEEVRGEFLGDLKTFVGEMDEEGEGWFSKGGFGLVDVSFLPWAGRLWLIDHYKEGGVGIPKGGEGRAGLEEGERRVWERWDRWLGAVMGREAVKGTWSERGEYVGVYKRYAEDQTGSEVGRRSHQTRPRAAANNNYSTKGSHFEDDFDTFDDYGHHPGGSNDFSLQGKSPSHQPKPKKKKKGKKINRKMGQDHSIIDEDTPPKTLSSRTLSSVAKYILSGRARRIVVMTGAGISTAAGIPDFRSPDTGLYANLASLDLPEPEAVFDLGFFKLNPRPFYVLAKELYPGNYHPTVSHVFVRLLAEKGLLHQLFTQNIDCLEREAGIPGEKIIEAHGSFASQRCIECKAEFDAAKMREFVSRGEVPRCEEEGCGGLVKPDIVFFGEQLPKAFFDRKDMAEEADLVLVMGTSLQVHPFAGLVNLAEERVPRVLFNLERVGGMGSQADDVLVLGDCDEGVRKLADELGWREELEEKWRKLVGDKEAERQLQGAKKRVEALHDEVAKLAEEVDEVLHLGEKKEKEASNPEDKPDGEGKVANEVDPVVEDVAAIKSSVKNTDITKTVEVSVETTSALNPVDMPDGEGKIVDEQKAGGEHSGDNKSSL
ncbi:NAD-dependent protein deacetylase hst2-1 [Cercophora samala]|uniref:NAD-dependent protein deacetylase hst2-1 n=1 Tax=Cercophora samala TaxID=330535 RepID=A0AA39ZCT9_9PEZI|nr:NAD-dependent protein deacetylase hst2-1 [Cercophora samala]